MKKEIFKSRSQGKRNRQKRKKRKKENLEDIEKGGQTENRKKEIGACICVCIGCVFQVIYEQTDNFRNYLSKKISIFFHIYFRINKVRVYSHNNNLKSNKNKYTSNKFCFYLYIFHFFLFYRLFIPFQVFWIFHSLLHFLEFFFFFFSF